MPILVTVLGKVTIKGSKLHIQNFNTENGKEYLSGTKFLHLFEPEFDSYNISLRVAAKEGRTQEEVLNEWKETSRIACETGTKIHAIMENFIKFNDVNEEYDILYKTFKKCAASLPPEKFRKGELTA